MSLLPHGQDLLFRCLGNSNIMNELIERFSNKKKGSFLADLLKERRKFSSINQTFLINTKFTLDNIDGNHSIYINYFNNGTKVFHGSIHLCPNNFKTQNSPAHYKENSYSGISLQPKPTQVIELCNNTNGISFCLGQFLSGISFYDSSLQYEVKAIQNVLTKYFDKNNAQT